ncbi:hypothetical protein ACCS70_18915 [Rhizobium ruizarguesonis]
MSFFVVFDTCTHPAYYGDVHEVLSLPEGAVIRYEYKRRLFSAAAASEMETLISNPFYLPIPALLMYGEKRGFEHGHSDPTDMLTTADSVFVPTRSANLVAVAMDKAATTSEDVFYMHFQLRGFIDPAIPVLGELVASLETANSLPFGDRQQQHKWVSLVPPAMAAKEAQLVSDDQTLWTRVIEAFVLSPTQFKNDVFWRVQSLVEVKNGQPGATVPLQDRATNEQVHADRWRRDYRLNEGKRYAVKIQTYSPDGHGVTVPACATVAMTSRDDDEGLVKLSADPMNVIPNQIEHKRFAISMDSALDTRFTGIHLETQVPDYTSKFASGSMCTLTFSIRKERWRVIIGSVLVLAGIGVGGYTVGAKPDGSWSAGLGVAAVLAIAVGGYLLTRQFKISK